MKKILNSHQVELTFLSDRTSIELSTDKELIAAKSTEFDIKDSNATKHRLTVYPKSNGTYRIDVHRINNANPNQPLSTSENIEEVCSKLIFADKVLALLEKYDPMEYRDLKNDYFSGKKKIENMSPTELRILLNFVAESSITEEKFQINYYNKK